MFPRQNEECGIPFALKMRNDKNKPESKSRKEMIETSDAVRAVRRTRTRALIVPREHGAWGLLLVPLFTGVVAGFASEHSDLAVAHVHSSCAVFVLAADTGRKPDWHQFADGRYSKRKADGACRSNFVGGSGDRLFDRR